MNTSAPGRASAPGRPTGTPAIDPIRLLKKYKWVLAASVVLGVAAGIGLYMGLRKIAPSYDSFAIFRIMGPRQDAIDVYAVTREDEMERYQASQVSLMVSDAVLQRVVNLPRLSQDVPKWHKQFSKAGTFDSREAKIDLAERVKARVLPGTEFVRLGASWSDKTEVATLVQRVREEYQAMISAQSSADFRRQTDILQRQWNTNDDEMRTLVGKRDDELRRAGIDSIDTRLNEARNSVAGVNAQLNQARLDIQGVQSALTRYETDAKNPQGPRYDDDLRSRVDASPIIVNMKQRVALLESSLLSLDRQGIGAGHMEYRALQADLAAQRDLLERRRQEELNQQFFGQIQALRNQLASLQAQEADLAGRHTKLVEQLNGVLLTQLTVADFGAKIDELRAKNADLLREIDNRRQLQQQFEREAQAGQRLVFEDRVQLVQRETPPDQMAFPKLPIMLAAGLFVVVGLTGAIIVLRELVDQRIKGPGDVAMIPRARVLGLVSRAGDDTSLKGPIERLFTGEGGARGVIAEQYRQLRAPLLKRMREESRKSVLVTAGLPGSGATATAVNLAAGAAASGQRVLLIDANLRRPAVAKALGLSPESPGLADALAAGGSMSGLTQKFQAGDSSLDVLSAGTPAQRVFERLGTDAMGRLLSDAAQNYDLIVLDTPPMVVAGDALGLANRVDATMLVVRAYSEKRGLVMRLSRELNDARGAFMGVVVNAVRPSAGGYMRKNIRATAAYARSA